VEKLIQTLTERRLSILFILKLVPLDLWDWKPEKTMRSMSELANHIACSPLGMSELLKGNLPNEESYNLLEKNNMPLNAQGLVKLYEVGLKNLIAYCEAHKDNSRELNVQFYYQTKKSSIYQEIFDEIGHEWFHLGQIYVYLKQNNIHVDMGAYYGYRDPDPSIKPNS
jgi:uncharacterized damage-inducible protein DinB